VRKDGAVGERRLFYLEKREAAEDARKRIVFL